MAQTKNIQTNTRKATTNTKKKAATTVGGGGRATKVSRLNLKLVIPMVLVVAALGGFYIFMKSSASGRAFWHDYESNQLKGGGTHQIGWDMYKTGISSSYDSGYKFRVYTMTPELNIKKKNGLVNGAHTICAYVAPFVNQTVQFRVRVSGVSGGWGNSESYASVKNSVNIKKEICVGGIQNHAGKQLVEVFGSDAFGVNTIYSAGGA